MENKMEKILSITAKDIQNINKLIKVDDDGRIRKIVSQFASSEEEEELLMLKATLLLEFNVPIFEVKLNAPTHAEEFEKLTEKRPDWAIEKDILQDGHVCAKQLSTGNVLIFSLVALRKRATKTLPPVIIYGSVLKKTTDGEIIPSNSHNTGGIGYWSEDVRPATTEEIELFYKTFPKERDRRIYEIYKRSTNEQKRA